MSYHLTNTLPEKSRISSRSQLAKTDPPSKNRVWKFSTQTYSRTWPNHQETPETTSETSVTITITVSGLPFWPSRDPLGEEGFRVGNKAVFRWLLANENIDPAHVEGVVRDPDRIVQDVLDEKEILDKVGANLYLFVGNVPLSQYDVIGLRCKIVVAMGHRSYIRRIVRVMRPDSCDRFGNISCGLPEGSPATIPGWPTMPSLTYCSDVPRLLRAAGGATTAEATAMCDPPCCCSSVSLRFICDSDMNRCLRSLLRRGQIARNYCGTSRTYSCP